MMNVNLKKAISETYENRILNEIPDIGNHTFSKESEDKMNSFLNPGIRKISAKKFFVCITAAIIAATIMALNAGAIKNSFNNFIMKAFDTHTEIKSEIFDNGSDIITDKHILDIPYGFDLSNSFDNEIVTMYEYGNKDGKYIVFTQTAKTYFDTNINTEDSSMKYISAESFDGYAVEIDTDEYYILWNNDSYVFEITGNIGKDALIEIANSV